MTFCYLIKVGLQLTPFLVQQTSVDKLVDFSELKIADEYKNLPFQIELMLFNLEGTCLQYLCHDSYSFKLKTDLKDMTNHMLDYIEKE